MPTHQVVILVAIVGMLLLCLAILVFALSLFRPWLRGFTSGAHVNVLQLLGMRLRGNPPGLLVDTFITLRHREIDASIRDVESCYLANKGLVDKPARLAGIVEERLRSRAAAEASK